jgi:CRP-like cAMP-binding protein
MALTEHSFLPREDTRTNSLLAALPAAEQALLAPQIRSIELTRGVVLETLGERTEHVHFPCSGALVSLLQNMQDGAAVEVAAIGGEGMIGGMAVLGSGFALAQATVQLPGLFLRIPAASFATVMQAHPALRDKVVQYNELLVAQMQQSIARNALHDVESRLCRWLLQTQDRTGSDILPFTQELLGQMLGVRRTTITLVARMLQSADMIRWSRGRVEILDRQALEHAACECYATTRERTQRFLAPERPSASSPHRFPRL